LNFAILDAVVEHVKFKIKMDGLKRNLKELGSKETFWFREAPGLFPLIPFRCLVLSVVCETWSLTLREEHRLRVFENRVLRRIFGPKRFEVTGGWRKLHNEELHNLYSSPNIIRMIKSRACSTNGGKRNAYRTLVGKQEGKRPLGRSRRGWVNNIKMDLREIGCGGMDWIDLAEDRDQWRALMNAVMNLRVP
jgi:hypothetical protein